MFHLVATTKLKQCTVHVHCNNPLVALKARHLSHRLIVSEQALGGNLLGFWIFMATFYHQVPYYDVTMT